MLLLRKCKTNTSSINCFHVLSEISFCLYSSISLIRPLSPKAIPPIRPDFRCTTIIEHYYIDSHKRGSPFYKIIIHPSYKIIFHCRSGGLIKGGQLCLYHLHLMRNHLLGVVVGGILLGKIILPYPL